MKNYKMKPWILAAAISSVFAFNNPVIPNQDVPDPGAILYNGTYYVVTTGGDGFGNKFPIHTSPDLQNWTQVGFAIPRAYIPTWVGTPNSDFWAPEIHIVDGKFMLYYTARDKPTNILCIGVGVSDKILGPYDDLTGKAIVRQETVGSIDSTIMKVENDTYLVWKDDGNGNRPQIPTWIWAAKLVPNGTALVQNTTWYRLIRNDQPWENDLVEGPWIVHRPDPSNVTNGTTYLFYSANGYCGPSYAVGIARSFKGPLGPYEKRKEPIRVSDNLFKGPGHCSVIQVKPEQSQAGKYSHVMVYHSWINGKVCDGNNRVMLVSYINWEGPDGWPEVILSSDDMVQPII